MGIFREPSKNKLHTVTLSSLMALCKDKDEQDKLLDAIADMELQGEAMLTLDSKVRTMAYINALQNAGLSQETIDSILKEGDMSGLLGSKESQLAESYLRENLKMGRYVEREDVDKVVKQLQDDLKNGVQPKIAQKRFEDSMQSLCDNAKKFDSKFLSEEQIRKGKDGKNYDIYRMDKEGGLCVTEVPKAVIAANKDELVAALRSQLEKEMKTSQSHAHSVGNGAKQMVKGDAENMSYGTMQMTASAALFIFSKLMELAKRMEIERALKQGNVDIQDTVNNLIDMEKDSMVEDMEQDIPVWKSDIDEFDEVLDDL